MKKLADAAKVDTRPKIVCKGSIPPESNPITRTYRVTEDMDAFLEDHVKGNKSLVLVAMFHFARRHLKKKLEQGDFNIKTWLDPM